jgi:surface polysaccharide O-acyltransferase-like enzyme
MELFGAYGNLFVTAFAASIFVLILSLESFWKSRLSSGVKHCISGLARLSMGVYFVHMLFLITIGNSKIFGVAFTNNVGSLHNMVLGSVIYFTCSAMFVCVLSHIPIIRKVVN